MQHIWFEKENQELMEQVGLIVKKLIKHREKEIKQDGYKYMCHVSSHNLLGSCWTLQWLRTVGGGGGESSLQP